MFLAHLPAGFLLTRFMLRRSAGCAIKPRYLMALGLFASLAPDLDLFYYFIFDESRQFHHFYWPHIPFFIVALWAVALVVLRLRGKMHYGLAAHIVAANMLLHMVLDTTTTWIMWFYPLSVWQVGFPELKPYQFICETIIITVAAIVFIRDEMKRRKICNS